MTVAFLLVGKLFGRFLLLLCFSFAAHLCWGVGVSNASTKHIVLIAGPKSHGLGEHEYLKSIKLLKFLLDRAPNLGGVQTDIYFNGWPDDPSVLDRADAIAFFSDGEGGFGPDSPRAPFMTDERMKIIEKQIKRGCGFVTYHHSTFSSAKYAPQILSWNGGYFDWHSGHGEGGFVVVKDGALQLMTDGPLKQWHSAIRDMETDVVLPNPRHPIAEGVSSSFRFKDEYYYQLTFRQDDPNVIPILSAPALSSTASDHIVGWAMERKDGGRGFGTSTGHYFENWKNDHYRKLILNALVWAARVTVPKGGVESTYVNEIEVDRALMTRPIPALYVPDALETEEERKNSTGALAAVLNSEVPRFKVDMAENAAVLQRDLSQYKLLVVNNCSSIRSGLHPTARDGVLRFMKSGGGLAIISTADSRDRQAVSLSGSELTESWRICKEARWDRAEGQDRENIDPRTMSDTVYSVVLLQKNHPITRSVDAFEVSRYEAQENLAPMLNFTWEDRKHIQVLASARASGDTETPLAFIVQHENARIYQAVGGRDLRSVLRSPRLTQLIRYGCLWAAGE